MSTRLRIAGLTIDLEAEGGRVEAPGEFGAFVIEDDDAPADLTLRFASAAGREPLALGKRRFSAATIWDLHEAAEEDALVLRWIPNRRPGSGRCESLVAPDWSRVERWTEPWNETVTLERGRSELEIAVQTLLARLEGGFFVHACGVELNDRGVLVPGSSGAGKSTVAGAFPRASVLSDERVAVTSEDGALVLDGSPWSGTGGQASASRAPLGAVAFLGPHGAEPGLRRLGAAEAFRRLLFHAFPPFWDRPGLTRVLDVAQRVAESIPCYEVCYPLGAPVAPLLAEALA